MANVFDVAKYILREIGDISTMKLQKLCYYSNVEWIIETGTPLFTERFEAWANGPVCRNLFNIHKGRFTCDVAMIPNKLLENDLDSAKKTAINRVLENYGQKSGAELSALTHIEGPWLEARGILPESAPCRNIITIKSIADYYDSEPV